MGLVLTDIPRMRAFPEPKPQPGQLALQPGTPRRFGTEDIGRQGLLAGWAETEPGHAWNDGIDATLVLSSWRPEGPMEIELEAEPYVTRQNPIQELTLYANGARAGFWRLEQRDVVRLPAWIEPQWWRPAGRPRLAAAGVPHAAQPAAGRYRRGPPISASSVSASGASCCGRRAMGKGPAPPALHHLTKRQSPS